VIQRRCSELETIRHVQTKDMRSNKIARLGMRGRETRLATRGALEPVQIGSDLIAFYPQAFHQP
jgi:hypothetical protein